MKIVVLRLIESQVKSIAAGVIRRCKCRVSITSSLTKLNIIDNNLNIFTTLLNKKFKLKLKPEEVASKQTLKGVATYIHALIENKD